MRNILLVAALYVAAVGLIFVVVDRKVMIGAAFVLIGVEVVSEVMFPPHRET